MSTRGDAGSATRLGPRLVVAGTHSGVGKTTIATGIMAALASRGMKVAGAKVGPDFIDPGYHSVATGRPGRNLDAWICGPEAMAPLAARAGAGADVLVVEGVMGLFDGSSFERSPADASTAELSRLIEAPVLLVVDASGMSTSVAALVKGYSTFDRRVRVAGVILNRVGSGRHEELLREALASAGQPVLGALRNDASVTWRDRHLGLVPVVERPTQVHRSITRLSRTIEASCDLDGILALAASSPARETGHPRPARRSGRARVAVAGEPAFSFVYRDNLERLEEAGAELVPFDPIADHALPGGTQALYAGGGFPEAFLPALAENRPLLSAVAEQVRRGLPTWAECGGMLWMCRSLDGKALCGAIDAAGAMSGQLTLGYRRARTLVPTPLAPPGTVLRGHEFHYSMVDPCGDCFEIEGREGPRRAGFASPNLLASYLHLHLGSDPSPAERFVSQVRPGAS